MSLRIILVAIFAISTCQGQFFGPIGGIVSGGLNTANNAAGAVGNTANRVADTVGATRLLNAVDLSKFDPTKSIDSYWSDYLTIFNKTYSTPELTQFHKALFQDNMKLIHGHNNGSSLFSMQVYDFIDWDWPDFLKFKTGSVVDEKDTDNFISEFQKENPIKEELKVAKSVGTDDAVDWNAAGHVRSVKNQAECGGCWAFAAVGAIESQYSIKYGKKVDLSVQQLLDCDGKNKGCNGGNPYKALLTIAKQNLTFAENYPFKEKVSDTCALDSAKPTVTCKGFDINNYKLKGDEEALKKVIKDYGPVAATIRVTKNFSFYKSGIFIDEECEGERNHAIIVTGYGSENGQDFWIVKNTWGEEWGEKGYIRMARNKNNMCGIAYYGAVPYV